MGVIFRLALRNLREHKAKSVIIALFVVIGVVIVELGNAFLASVNTGLERDFRAHYTGDIVITGPVPQNSRMDIFGISSLQSLGDLQQLPAIPDLAATEKVIAAQKGISGESKMISTKAMLMNGDEADFDPDADHEGAPPNFFLFSGETETYFKLFPGQHLVEGTYPSDNEDTIMLDERLREKYRTYYKQDLKVGDLVLVAGANTAGIVRQAKVCGYYTQPDKDSAMYPLVYANPSFARAFADLTYGATFAQALPESVDTKTISDSEDDLFGSDSDSMVSSGTDILSKDKIDYNSILGDTSLRDKLNKADDGAWNFIVLKTDSPAQTEKIITSLNSAFTAQHIASRAINWKDAAATFLSTVSGISTLFTILVVILAVVVFIIIMNTMTVSVLERTGEIGTMRALGAEKNFIRKLFLTESVLITVFSACIGTILALIVMLIINSLGFTISGDMAKVVLGGGSISFLPTAGNSIGTIVLVTAGSVIANLYPVSSALKISPLKALSKGDD